MLIALATFFIAHNTAAKNSFVITVESALIVLACWAIYHTACVLWGIRCITGLYEDDPIMVATFIDERKELLAVSHSAALELKNHGKSAAYWIHVHPLKLRARTLYFPHVSDSIAPTDYRRFHAEVGDQWGYDSHHDLIRAMSEEWTSYEDCQPRREIVVPMRIDYEDGDGVRLEANSEMFYHGGKGWNQPSDFKCIECRNFIYKRIPTGTSLLNRRF